MAELNVKFVRFLDKIAHYLPVLDTLKKKLCLLRWEKYLKEIGKYSGLAKDDSLRANILVILGSGVGNAIESTPLVRAIRHIWPKSKITIRPPACGLFDNWSDVDKIAYSPQELKGMHFDHTFVAWAGSISQNKGYCPLGQIHFTQDGQNTKAEKSERQYNIDILRRLGYEGPTPKPYVHSEKPKVQIPASVFRICIVPGGNAEFKWRHKRWPYYGKLVRILLDKHSDIQIVILGAKDDYIEGDFSGGRVIDLRGRLSWPQTAWVIKNSKVTIGNDCGPMHITGATDTPAVIIYGPTCEIKNAPAGEFIPVRNIVPCAPCQYGRLLLTCKDPICMNQLRPEHVFDSIKQILK
ncbi:MAG: glycosyltransferase family 9 protein [Sedimentisphaerales bacterium]|nr:glycosyltransferase family 9 protein [Sedimentisphaerales bacterium]